jgi:hypothetical protein
MKKRGGLHQSRFAFVDSKWARNMLQNKPLTAATVIGALSHLAYKYWSRYPNLVPSRRAVVRLIE